MSDRLETSRPGRLRGVAVIAPGFDVSGGMERQARRLAEGMASQGVPITYITTAAPGGGLPAHEVRGLVQVFRVPVLTLVDWETSLDVLELAALGILASRRDRLDGIYAVHWQTGAIASRLGAAFGVPVVIKLACSGPPGDARSVLASPRREAHLDALRAATHVVAITDAIAREATELLGLDPARIVRLWNGVDLELFKPRPGGVTPTETRAVLYLGRLDHQKRVDVLLDAWKRVVTARPTERLELAIAGVGPLQSELEARARRLEVEGSVRFHGRVEDPTELFARAVAFALPSEAEGASNALLEALASGVPSVATRIAGTTDLVRDGQDALLVPPGDAAALADALGRLLDDPALARRLSEAGRRRVEESFDLEAVVTRHVLLFEDLKAARGGGAFDGTALAAAGPGLAAGLAASSAGNAALVRLGLATSLRASLDGARSTMALLQEQARRLVGGQSTRRERGVAILVHDIDQLGGMERQAALLARGLASRGARVLVLTCTSPGLVAAPRGAWTEERDGYTLIRLPRLLFEPAAAGVLFAHREEWGTLYAVQLMMGAIAARLGPVLGAPVVVKLTGAGESGDMAALRALPESDRELIREDLSRCHVTCPSEELRDEALAEGLPTERLVRLGNGVDVDAVARATPVRAAGDQPGILYLGRLSREKGVDVLIDAYAEVRKKLPHALLVIAGEGPEREALVEQTRRLNVQGGVTFLGRRDDAWGLLRGMTVAALPSRAEGLSNALLEALAAGTPVVASALPSTVEALGPGGGEHGGDPAGIVVPPGDAAALAAKLILVLERPDLRARLSRAGQARVRAAYAIDRILSDHEALFARLTPEPAPGTLQFASRFLGARGRDVLRVLRR